MNILRKPLLLGCIVVSALIGASIAELLHNPVNTVRSEMNHEIQVRLLQDAYSLCTHMYLTQKHESDKRMNILAIAGLWRDESKYLSDSSNWGLSCNHTIARALLRHEPISDARKGIIDGLIMSDGPARPSYSINTIHGVSY